MNDPVEKIRQSISEEFELFYDEMCKRHPPIKDGDKSVLRSFYSHGGDFAWKQFRDIIDTISGNPNEIQPRT